MGMLMFSPKILCNKHLLYEHCECHKFVEYINSGKPIDIIIHNNLLEINSIERRHDEISNEMIERGIKHRSPLKKIISDIEYEKLLDIRIDKKKSLQYIISKCEECKRRYLDI